MKKYILFGIVISSLSSSFLFAEGPYQMNQSNQTNPNPPPMSDSSAYWQAQKVEQQNKSTAMRQQKYAQLKAKGVDVSVLTPDILDGTKTDEGKFWDAMKIIEKNQDSLGRQSYIDELNKKGINTSSISGDLLDANKTDSKTFWDTLKALQQSNEIQSRKDYLAKIAMQGTDTSGFTDAIITNGNAFWELARKLQTIPPMKNSPQGDNTYKENFTPSYQELSTRTKIVEELQRHGIDTSQFTPEVLANPEAFSKLIETIKKSKGPFNPSERQSSPPPRLERNDGSSQMNSEGGTGVSTDFNTPIKKPQLGLTQKSKDALRARLDKIPSEKKEAVLQNFVTQIQTQIDAATIKGNKRLVAKLQDMLDIVQDEQSDASDSALLDSVLGTNQ